MATSTYSYKITKVIKVMDGDTVQVEVDLGFFVKYTAKVRLEGLKAPEIRIAEQKENALKVRDYVSSFLNEQIASKTLLRLTSRRQEKYGRWLGEIYIGLEQRPLTALIKVFMQENNISEN